MNTLRERIAVIDRPDVRWMAVLVLGAVAIGLVTGNPDWRDAVVAAGAALAMLGVVALLMWKTELAIPTMLVAASFDLGGRIVSEPFPITAYQLVLLVGLASWALRLIRREETAKPQFTLVDLGMLLLLGAALWSLPFSLDPGATVKAFIRLVFIYLFYQLCFTFLRQRWVAAVSTTVLVVAGAFHGLVAFAQVRGVVIGNVSVHIAGLNSPLRGAAFFHDPNYLAMMLGAAILVAAVRVVHARTWWHALPWLAAAVLAVLGVYATYSRTGLLTLALGMVVVWALAPSGRKRWVFFAGVLAAVVLLTSNSEVFIGRFTELVNFEADPSSATRYYMLNSTLEVIRDYWAMGTGLAAFEKAYPIYRIAGSHFTVIKPHQLPLAMWAEMGVAGVLAEVVLTFAVVRMVWRSIVSRAGSGASRNVVDVLAEAGNRLTQDQKAGLAIIVSFALGSLLQYYLYVEYLWFGVALLTASTVARRASSLEVLDV